MMVINEENLLLNSSLQFSCTLPYIQLAMLPEEVVQNLCQAKIDHTFSLNDLHLHSRLLAWMILKYGLEYITRLFLSLHTIK